MAVPPSDLVERDFRPTAPDRLWVADITQHGPVKGGCYLAVVIDAFSRRVVGWSMAAHLRTELVLDALDMAIWTADPTTGSSTTPTTAAQGGFNGSSQHCLVRPSVGWSSRPRRVSSSRGSCGAGC